MLGADGVYSLRKDYRLVFANCFTFLNQICSSLIQIRFSLY